MRRRDKWIRYIEPHGLGRIYQRGVTRDQVVKTIHESDRTRAGRWGRTIFEKRLSRNRRLSVVTKETSDEIWVVTAFWM